MRKLATVITSALLGLSAVNALAETHEAQCGHRAVIRVSDDEVRMTKPRENFIGGDGKYVSTNGNTYTVDVADWTAQLERADGKITTCVLAAYGQSKK